MATSTPSQNDGEFDLLKKIVNNTALSADAVGGVGSYPVVNDNTRSLLVKWLNNIAAQVT